MADGADIFTLSRRGFVIGSTGATAVLAFTGLTACGGPAEEAASPSEQIAAKSFEPTVWTEIHADGSIKVHIAKAEMGQHVGTALARVVAEELEADWSDIEIVHVDSDPKWGYMVTGGSWSVFTTFDELSRAGAAGRIAMIEAGAALMGVDAASCTARASKVVHAGGEMRYGDIVAQAELNRSFTDDDLQAITLKPASERRLLGKAIDALDIPEKTRGAATYGLDVELDGMVYARPVLPPTRYGSSVNSFDDSAAQEIAGYLQTVAINDPSGTCQGWLAVIAETWPAAQAAADALIVDWTPGPRAGVSEANILAEGRRLASDATAGAEWVRVGDPEGAFETAGQVVETEYTTNSVLHFQMEPVNALAMQDDDGHWRIHGGNQWQSLILPVLATALGVEESSITLHQYYLGGGFGRRLFGDYMVPAALASKALGRPVKMIFTREDDARFDCVRSPSVQKVRTGLNADGAPVAYEHRAAAGWPTYSMAPGFLAEVVDGTGKADGFSISGADHWYSIPNQRVAAIRNAVAQETFLPGWLRAVGPGWTHWAVEQHIDEVAHALGQDPIAFRLSLLTAEGRNAGKAPESIGGASRLAAVLRRARDKSGWAGRAELPDATGLGVALCTGQERTMPTWLATVARVSVDRESGRVRVDKLTQVVDCGTVVHPDGALAQIEGGALWGVSMALHEATALENGQVKDRNLDTYTPLRMADVPELDIEFFANDYVPTGLGEPGVSGVAPAIANAIFDAVGVRVRDLPMTPDRVKAALDA